MSSLCKRSMPRILAVLVMLSTVCIAVSALSAIVALDDVVPHPISTTIDDDLLIGNSSDGSLTVDSGSDIYALNARLGDKIGSNGTVTITDAGSSWQIRDDLTIGNAGVGSLNIIGGGQVSSLITQLGRSPGGSGTLTIDGAESYCLIDYLLSVGSFGFGQLDIVNGGQLTNLTASIGSAAGSTGLSSVAGPGSRWHTASLLSVGDSGSGQLDIANGGYVQSGDGYLGMAPRSTGIVTLEGADSQWNNNNSLTVGGLGSGTLNIFAGAVVNSIDGYVGFQVGSTGRVEVKGTNAKWSSYFLWIGRAGSGAVRIADGGLVESSYNAVVGYASGSKGEVTIDGVASSWDISDSLDIGPEGTGTVTQNGGRVDVRGTNGIHLGGHGIGRGTYILAGGILDLHGHDIHGGADTAVFDFTGGTLRNVETFGLDLDQRGGTLAAGASPGSMAIVGDYTLHDGATLKVELAGSGSIPGTDFDYYEVQGMAALFGELSIQLFDSFTPTYGESFDVLHAESIDITGLTLSGPSEFVVSIFSGMNGDRLRLTYLPIPEPTLLGLLLSGLIVSLRGWRRLRR